MHVYRISPFCTFSIFLLFCHNLIITAMKLVHQVHCYLGGKLKNVDLFRSVSKQTKRVKMGRKLAYVYIKLVFYECYWYSFSAAVLISHVCIIAPIFYNVAACKVALSYILAFFISNSLISNTILKLAKNQAKSTQHYEVELLSFENDLLSPSMLSSKNNTRSSG